MKSYPYRSNLDKYQDAEYEAFKARHYFDGTEKLMRLAFNQGFNVLASLDPRIVELADEALKENPSLTKRTIDY